MTEKVIDSSALAAFLLKEEGWKRVREILREKPYTIELAIKEVANSIWKRAKLLKDVDENKALTILGDLLKLRRTALRIEPQDIYLGQALEIALKNDATIYDSLFITQALAKKAILVTLDKKQAEIANKMGVRSIMLE
ncbi:type II toxin-antitoxin system VapC family toxin [Candidatus Bathyarchaeota archaeon]|nr:type II toxin-antitoxin system VapC family toxin [Candidatus Bathyarchaeota archaeon]